MKRFEFIFPMEIKKRILVFAVILCFFLIISILSRDIRIIFPSAFLLMFLYFQEYNIYYRYRITENGIENKHLSFQWREIDKIEIVYTEQHLRNLKKRVYPPIACIGETNEKSLFKQNRRKCVFFPITQRNLELIEKYSKGENEALNDLVNQYIDYPDEKIKTVFW